MQNKPVTQNKPVALRAAGEVSFVIVTYWTGPLLARAVASCLAQGATREVILVNNGNWPDFATKLQAEIGDAMQNVHILTGHGNIGFAKACNLGAAQATGTHLFFLNPDAELNEDTLDILFNEGRKLEQPWMLGGRLLNRDGSEQAGARRQVLTPGIAFIEMTRAYKFAPNHPFFRRFNDHEKACPEVTTAQPVISGACMFLPRESYFAIGGMDEAFFLHLEDVDFCVRFSKADGRILFVPDAVVRHAKSASRSSAVRVERHKAASLCRYFFKHYTGVYPRLFLWFVWLLVWASFCLRAGRFFVKSVMRLLAPRLFASGFSRGRFVQVRSMKGRLLKGSRTGFWSTMRRARGIFKNQRRR